jgi:quinol monooxygenase YgiN
VKGRITMANVALYVGMEAKSGKEAEVAEFLKEAESMVAAETGTLTWHAIQMGPSSFAIFDTFPDEQSREDHLNGDIGQALMARADDLFSEAPNIDKSDVLAFSIRQG